MRKAVAIFTAMLMAMMMLAMPVNAVVADLVGIWHFDEGIGSTAHDSSGLGNDGALSGGKFGNALSFDGMAGYVEVQDSVDLDLTVFTIEAWIYVKNLRTSNAIIVKGPDNGENYEILVGFPSNDDVHSPILFTDGRHWMSTGGVITINEWHHVALTYQPNEWRIYVDGIKKAERTDVDGTPASNNSPLWIGNEQGTSGRVMDGLIDEVRISVNIRYSGSSFTLPVAPFSPDGNTKGLWHFDESVGTTAFDSSGNGHNGEIYDASWNGPVWTSTAKYGTALSFDGVDDYAWMQDNPSLDFGAGDSFTLEAWIKTTDSDLGYNNILRKDNNAMGEARALWLIAVYNPGGRLRGFIYDASGHWLFIESSTSVNDGEWHHVAFVRDVANDKLGLYVDGSEDPVTPVTDTTIDTLENSGWGAIGAYANPAGQGEFFKGVIDEARIYNIALSADQIKLQSMDIYSVNFLPPFKGKVGSTIPIKWVALDGSGDFVINEDVEIELWKGTELYSATYSPIASTFPPGSYMSNGMDNNIRINPGDNYIISWHTGITPDQAGTYTAKIYIDGIPAATQDYILRVK